MCLCETKCQGGGIAPFWGSANVLELGARLRGRRTTQSSKKGSEKVLGRALGKGSEKGA